MKNILLYIYVLLLAVNLVIGLLITAYDGFHVALTSGTLVLSALLLCGVAYLPLRDGFRVSYSLLFAIMGLVNVAIALVAPTHIFNCWAIVALVLIYAFETALLVASCVVSKRVKN